MLTEVEVPVVVETEKEGAKARARFQISDMSLVCVSVGSGDGNMGREGYPDRDGPTLPPQETVLEMDHEEENDAPPMRALQLVRKFFKDRILCTSWGSISCGSSD